jgi:hypothetical protein
MMLHHPYALLLAVLITDTVGHFWRADPGHFSKALKAHSIQKWSDEHHPFAQAQSTLEAKRYTIVSALST